ncbi:hypothetical protein A5791_05100 [Mycobacterium sp. 852002-51163_SCH5372311]|uniref:hypothetical protein n=1 Tax=Mycobacterium sp. 852002-51163_SCH5372311 TaxID=1834097 RepID=UPI000800214D|nr:hypothetical protein [Mycobacterium sp. 852002-51163_SCH5372311]OBF81605.1 hypothetical protein A5791_05100 [Mycobacterium sp. 852002-51163_SCH5372311]
MTGPESETQDPNARPVSVAELLARNGTLGAPAVTRRRRRRRGDSDAVSVAELTGEIPIVDDEVDEAPKEVGPVASEEEVATEAEPGEDTGYWSEPEPRWPKSPPQAKRTGPERSAYPRPLPHGDEAERPGDQPGVQSGAEGMSPDPIGHYGDMPVDVMDSEVSEVEPATEDSAYVRSYLQAPEGTLFGGQTLADELARRRGDEAAAEAEAPPEDFDDDLEEAPEGRRPHARLEALWHGTVVVLQSILAVAFGAGLFIAFDQLWRWNSVVTLVLSVLVILGLVVGVRVVRKTEDIASTLIAVAVGALITWGPLVLSLQTG